jgi:2-iminobutanoate/2-iminopropanoate deaminase
MKTIYTNKAPQAVGPYSQAIQTGNYVFCSGQIGLNPTTMQLIEGGIENQTSQVLRNIEAVLESINLTLQNVVKVQIFLQDMGDFNLVNQIYAKFMNEHKPARDTVEVSKLPLNALIEISVIAFKE